ncbi:MAG TPA: DUF454 domain-containing protein [Acholeplasmataceae bacterium]|nr:DUF454 domain-containing protein [Acholeplasmataceae bacterium]
MKKIVWIILGTISLILGLIGIILPILPTTPFLLLTLTFYAKGSKKFEMWFKHTKLYLRYLEDFITHKAMKKKDKWMLMIFVDLVLIISIMLINNIFVTVALILLDIIKYIYFFTQVKTISTHKPHQTYTKQQKNTLA